MGHCTAKKGGIQTLYVCLVLVFNAALFCSKIWRNSAYERKRMDLEAYPIHTGFVPLAPTELQQGNFCLSSGGKAVLCCYWKASLGRLALNPTRPRCHSTDLG